MAACEKCWRDASTRAFFLGGSVSDHYRDLLHERRENPCAVEDASGRIIAPAQSPPTRPSGPWDTNGS